MLYFSINESTEAEFASAGRFEAKNAPIHPRRRLESHVLFIGVAGEYPIAVEGREYILKKNTFMLIPAGAEHYGTAPASEGQVHLWCHFYTEKVSISEACGDGSGIILPEYGTVKDCDRYSVLFGQLIDSAYRIYNDENSGQNICSKYISLILAELSDEYKGLLIGEGRKSTVRLVSQIEEYVRNNACDGIRVCDVSRYFNYSSDYLTQLLRSAKNISLSGLINKVRLTKAENMLIQTSFSVSEIASACGYSDSKYFMKSFRRAEGVTPSQFRRNCAHIHINHE